MLQILTKWLKRWEHESNHKLLGEKERDKYFCEFLVDALLRGNTRQRYEAYRVAISSGWMNRNEVRRKENLNEVDGLDEFLQPLNMSPSGMQNARALIEETWRRVIKKEINAIRTSLKKPEKFFERLDSFYDKLLEHTRGVFAPVIELIGDEQRHNTVIDDYIEQHRRSILELKGNQKDIEQLIYNWEIDEDVRLTDLMLKGEIQDALSK